MLIFFRKILFLCAVLILLAVTSVCADEPSVQIDIVGLKGAQLQNVERALTLPPGIVRNGKVEKHWLERYTGKVPGLVAEALEPFGYYQSKTVVATEQSDEGSYRVLVKVESGPPAIVRSLNIKVAGEGHQEPGLQREVSGFPLKKGMILDHQLYEQGKLNLRLAANDAGYLQASFDTRTIRVDLHENAADIDLVFETGPRFYFGETFFEDETESFDKDFLRRFLTYHPGDVFSHKELHLSRIGFYGANRFDEVLMVPLMDEVVDQHVPIRVKLVTGKQQRLRPGIGYGTNTGARLSLSYQNMQVGKSAQAYLFDLSLAEQAQSFETSYTIPQPGGQGNNLIGTLGLRREDLNTYQAEMIYFEGEETYSLGRGKTGSLFLRYLRESSDVGSDNNIARLLIPGLRYYQRSYDDPLRPRSGYQFRVELRASFDSLISDVSLGQVVTAGSIMWPLTEKFTLHTRAEAATTIKDDELSNVPPSLRFFVGGDNSVRGYSYKSRGPVDEFGDVTGGDSLIVGSIEGEYFLTDQWGLALFYDAGSAFNISHDFKVIQGAGIGVRRYTPIGPIKLDLAGQIGENDNGYRIHLSVGFDI